MGMQSIVQNTNHTARTQLQERPFHITAQRHAKYAKVWHRFIKGCAGQRDNGDIPVDPQNAS